MRFVARAQQGNRPLIAGHRQLAHLGRPILGLHERVVGSARCPRNGNDVALHQISVRGRAAQEAIESLRATGLIAAPRLGSPAPAAGLAGLVSSQNPSGATRVAPGSQVEIEIHGPFVDLRSVPDLVGRAAAQARTLAGQAGLTPDFRIGGPAPSADLVGTVSSQNPAAALRVEAGSTVELVVYGPYVQMALVPDLLGKTAGEAQSLLREAGLTGIMQLGGPAAAPSQAGRVQAQSVTTGTRVERGQQVTVTVSGPYADLAVVPNVVGLDEAAARRAIEQAGLRVRPGGPVTGLVASQRPTANQRVQMGGAVEIAFAVAAGTAATESPVRLPAATPVASPDSPAGVCGGVGRLEQLTKPFLDSHGVSSTNGSGESIVGRWMCRCPDSYASFGISTTPDDGGALCKPLAEANLCGRGQLRRITPANPVPRFEAPPIVSGWHCDCPGGLKSFGSGTELLWNSVIGCGGNVGDVMRGIPNGTVPADPPPGGRPLGQ